MADIGDNIWGSNSPAGPAIDIILIGLQTSAWLFLGILLFFGDSWLTSFLQKEQSISNTIIFSIALTIFGYSIGVIIDPLSVKFFDLICGKTRDKKCKQGRSTPEMNFEIMIKQEYVHQYFAGLNSRLRIAKGLLLNFPIFSILGLLYSYLKGIEILAEIFLLFICIVIWILIRHYCIHRDVHYNTAVITAYHKIKQLGQV